jgi:leucyl aminopeptidase
LSGTIRFHVKSGDLAGVQADLAILYQLKGSKEILGSADPALAARLAEVVRQDRFQGKAGRTHLWHAPPEDGLPCGRYLIVGLGAAEEITLDLYRRHLGTALVECDRLGATSVALPLLEAGASSFDARSRGIAVAEGVLLGTYRFDRYRAKPRAGRRHLQEVTLAVGSAPKVEVEAGVAVGEKTAAATNFARDLVNEPAGVMTPARMVEVARQVAADAGLEIKVIDPDEMQRLGMGGILGVSQGSRHAAQFVQLGYRPADGAKVKVALLGKGLTFDSGGLSLKSSTGMETMKCDMAGSAAVLATLKALPELACPVEVIGLMGLTENMPGGDAIKPGDVVRLMNGKTVEVRNTDAEGRLVLADALSYASTLDGVEVVIDVATLTGACVVALGPMASGVMGNDRALVDDLLRAAEGAGERMWPLPLYTEYREHIRSDIADIKNTGIRWGGAISAALFLREFVRPGLRWAHIDIAGPAFSEKDYSYMKKGGTGAGIRTLIRYLMERTA